MFQEFLQVDGAITIRVGVVEEPLDVVGVHMVKIFGMREGTKLVARQDTVPVNVGIVEFRIVL